jgi:hypothetical protein
VALVHPHKRKGGPLTSTQTSSSAMTGTRSQYSTTARIRRLRERLASERDQRVLETIKAQLAAFERPPRGTFD